jgi:uncharacterized protein (TIGR03437 family)
MRRTAGFVASLLAVLLLTGAALAQSTQTVAVRALLSPLAEVPPITDLNAGGGFLVTFNINRDASGNITGGTANFLGQVQFPSTVTIVGLHIHEGPAGTNGPVRIDTGITAANPVVILGGTGIVAPPTVASVDAMVLTRLLANPANFYINLHTTVHPSGAIRSQLVRTEETLGNTVPMSPSQEVPPIPAGNPDANATGTATITINPTRDAQGVATGGTINFAITYSGFPANTVIRGLHIHEAPAGANGPIRFDTGISAANPVNSPTGSGTINISAPVLNTDANRMAFRNLLANPANFYVNLHTNNNPGGAIRGQLTGFAQGPIIQQSNVYFVPAGTTDTQLILLVTGIDLASQVFINGQMVQGTLNPLNGNLGITIPGALRTAGGRLNIQVSNSQGQLSAPLSVIVATEANTNAQAIVTVDAAKFGPAPVAAPGSIAAAFGTQLATGNASAPAGQPLPTTLGGTTVYVNGTAAPLFFVSATQVNYLIPVGTVPGPTSVVVVNGSGVVSRGTVNVLQSTASIFTAKADGTGAPAAVASTDGTNFNINVGNADGSATPLDAGNFVALFGTGLRFASGPVTISIGGTTVTPLFVGAAPGFEGLDQINLQIPASLAGRGEVDLIITAEGRASNTVKLRIR